MRITWNFVFLDLRKFFKAVCLCEDETIFLPTWSLQDLETSFIAVNKSSVRISFPCNRTQLERLICVSKALLRMYMESVWSDSFKEVKLLSRAYKAPWENSLVPWANKFLGSLIRWVRMVTSQQMQEPLEERDYLKCISIVSKGWWQDCM